MRSGHRILTAVDDGAAGYYERFGFRRAPEHPLRLARKISDIVASLALG